MNDETAAALRAAAHDLILQSGFAEQSALHHRTQAEAHATRAEGLRKAANVITDAITEESDLATELAEQGLRACCGKPSAEHCL